jgi:hypothetical protein
MTFEATVDVRVAVADLAVVEVDQLAQRLDPFHVHVAEVELVEPLRSVSVEDVIELGDHPFLAQHLMHLGLQARGAAGPAWPVMPRTGLCRGRAGRPAGVR